MKVEFDFTPRFKRAYVKLPEKARALFGDKMHQFLYDWRHPSFRVKKIQGTEIVWEASLNMSIQFTFEFSKDQDGTAICILLNIGDHDHVLRPPVLTNKSKGTPAIRCPVFVNIFSK